MSSKSFALVLSFLLAVPAQAGTGKVNVNIGSVGAGGSGVAAAGASLSPTGANLTLPQNSTLNQWIGDTISPTGALQTIPTAALASGLRQSLPQVSAAVHRVSVTKDPVAAQF